MPLYTKLLLILSKSINLLYLAHLSDLVIEPLFKNIALDEIAKSEIKLSSVSPDL